MTDYPKLLSIAQKLGVQADIAEAAKLSARAKMKDAPLVLPLVGEFSAGKTTLVNALTDSKVLETATEPTTATIYEIHFGQPEARATVVDENGETRPADINNLKNADLKNAYEVILADTSKRIPPSIVLVDTPGLSSPDPKHRQVLVDFMPAADGVLLVVDINAQFSRSLLDFVKDMNLACRPVFIVVTKCDGKTKAECDSTRDVLSKNSGVAPENIVFVSASKGQVDDLERLLDRVQADKTAIQQSVDAVRAKALAARMAAYIDEILAAAKSDKDIEAGLRKAQSDLDSVLQDIDRIAADAQSDLDEAAQETERAFESEVSSRLNTIAASKGVNYDQEAFSAVNSTASVIMGRFRSKVQSIVSATASKTLGHGQLQLASAQGVDLSCVKSQALSYNIDLNTAGHEYDADIAKWILLGGAGVAAVATMGAAAPAAGTAATAIGSSTAVEVGEMGVMAYQAQKLSKLQRMTTDMVQRGEQMNQQLSQKFNMKKGFIESAVGWVSENVFGQGKPQRMRAVSNYVDGTLMPQFRSQLDGIKSVIISGVTDSIRQEAQGLVDQKKDALSKLRSDMESDKAAAEQKKAQFKALKSELQSAIA